MQKGLCREMCVHKNGVILIVVLGVVVVLHFKGTTIATRAASKWGGAMIKLSGLSTRNSTSVVMFTIESS